MYKCNEDRLAVVEAAASGTRNDHILALLNPSTIQKLFRQVDRLSTHIFHSVLAQCIVCAARVVASADGKKQLARATSVNTMRGLNILKMVM